MARIVLGAGTSHTPLLTLPAEEWIHRSAADLKNPRLNLSDGRFVTYSELLEEVGDRYSDDAAESILKTKAVACQKALDKLAVEIEAAAPDVVVIVGDDQNELFGPENQPAFAVFYGDQVVTANRFGADELPDWMRTMGRGYMMDEVHKLPGARDLALGIIKELLEQNVDVAVCGAVSDPDKAAFGHAYGFVVQRLFRGKSIPILPVLLNTYYPPNVPSAARCFDIGQALRIAIESSPTDLRVAVIASGGLSHFVVDEALDRSVLDAISGGSAEDLRKIPRAALNSGSSEILNWVLTAGAVSHLPFAWSEYQPIYRTPAGTGVGAAIAVWRNP